MFLHQFSDDLVLALDLLLNRGDGPLVLEQTLRFLRSNAAEPFSRNRLCQAGKRQGCWRYSSQRSEMGKRSIRWRRRITTLSSGE
jgi:hypothetical protein